MSIAVQTQAIRLSFGAAESRCQADGSGIRFDLAVPVLSGEREEVLLESTAEPKSAGKVGFKVLESDTLTAGVVMVPCHGQAEEAAFEIYRDLLSLLEERTLYRAWNFVPHINQEVGGLENYRSFNVGRWKAFRDSFGEDTMENHFPAASAVGIDEDCLAVVFLAGRDPVSYVENPQQTPAYRYPADFGPRSPSFARGTVVSRENRRTGYLSGTSSIRGSETIGIGELKDQYKLTFENIECVLDRMGFQDGLSGSWFSPPQYRVYVRDREEFDQVYSLFDKTVGKEATESALFLEADICRAPLKLEIEGIFFA